MDITTEPFQWTVPRTPGEPGAERLLRGKVVRPHGGADGERLPHIVILHGFKGFMDWGFFPELARRIAERGLAAVLFNMSGSGIGEDPLEFTDVEGFAKNTHSRELDDVACVRARLRSGELAGIDPDRACLLGHSRGGGTALIHAADDGGYAGVVTWAALDDFDRYDEATKDLWRAEGEIWIPNARTGQPHRMDLDLLTDLEQNRSRLDIRAACSRLSTPTLLVHGTADASVTPDALDRLSAALPQGVGQTLVIDGAGHTFGAGHPFGSPTPEWDTAVAATLDHVSGALGL